MSNVVANCSSVEAISVGHSVSSINQCWNLNHCYFNIKSEAWDDRRNECDNGGTNECYYQQLADLYEGHYKGCAKNSGPRAMQVQKI